MKETKKLIKKNIWDQVRGAEALYPPWSYHQPRSYHQPHPWTIAIKFLIKSSWIGTHNSFGGQEPTVFPFAKQDNKAVLSHFTQSSVSNWCDLAYLLRGWAFAISSKAIIATGHECSWGAKKCGRNSVQWEEFNLASGKTFLKKQTNKQNKILSCAICTRRRRELLIRTWMLVMGRWWPTAGSGAPSAAVLGTF